MDRRRLMGWAALALTGLPVRAAAAAFQPEEPIPLWPAGPPGRDVPPLSLKTEERGATPELHDRLISSIAYPVLTPIRPQTPDGSALLIIPGGGYLYEAIDIEGFAPAALFAAHGITSFVLTYRLPSEGWTHRPNVPLEDAQRAMRIIRAHVQDYGLQPTRVGALGFSAGGHLAASLATNLTKPMYSSMDAIDGYDAKPSFAALLYPVVTMLPPFAHEASRERLLGLNATTAMRTAYSVERAVSEATPPCFLCATDDDPDVPVDNTLMMFQSLRTAKVPSEMHIFEKGGHGFGLALPSEPVSQWPELFLRWGAAQGYFRNPA
ncbi:MAG TPA: alpha/beta hydrolase [Rhizomicrobium sp.]|nr:alpha/beta hydrolase [Rhizomicrobium sp.]